MISLLIQLADPRPPKRETFFSLTEYNDSVINQMQQVIEMKSQFFSLQVPEEQHEHPICDPPEEEIDTDWTEIAKIDKVLLLDFKVIINFHRKKYNRPACTLQNMHLIFSILIGGFLTEIFCLVRFSRKL